MNIEIIYTTTDQLDAQAFRGLEFPRPAVLGIASGIFFMMPRHLTVHVDGAIKLANIERLKGLIGP